MSCVDCNCLTEETTESLPVRNTANSSVVLKKSLPRRNVRTIPDEILLDEALNRAISVLPKNYNFEIHKTIWKIRTEKPGSIALQFPEGLLLYACVIADIFECFANCKVMILGDVTYGACCIDDFTAQKLGAGLLVHYGHSCLVPVDVTRIKVIYVFVEIHFDSEHLERCVIEAFPPETKLALMGTIQFTSVIHSAAVKLKKHFTNCQIPQAKPLSAGIIFCFVFVISLRRFNILTFFAPSSCSFIRLFVRLFVRIVL